MSHIGIGKYLYEINLASSDCTSNGQKHTVCITDLQKNKHINIYVDLDFHEVGYHVCSKKQNIICAR